MNRHGILFVLCLYSCVVFGTSIVPFETFNQLSSASDAIYLVKANEINETIDFNTVNYSQSFTILKVVKGPNHKDIIIPYYSKKEGDYVNTIYGEEPYEEGAHFLLFLSETGPGEYYPICMSYYSFIEHEEDGISYFVPTFRQGNIHLLKDAKESVLQVFEKNILLSSLEKNVQSNENILTSKIAAPSEKQHLISKMLKTPSYCNYLQSGGRRFRVKDLGSQNLPVYYSNSGSGCSNIQSEMSEAINHMKEHYRGINLTLGGTYSGFNSNCAGGNAYNLSYFGGNYDTYIQDRFNTDRAIMVMFSDPCNQIPNLSGCNGTVAIGGSWALGTHAFEGETFNSAVYGYVIVNENVGNCNCGDNNNANAVSDYSAIIAHEITHAIGLGHITSGSANMNPSNGGDISSLDIQCVNDLYPVTNQTPQDEKIGEVGTITLSQVSKSSWRTINLTKSYTNPVVVMGTLSRNGSHQSVVRVRNVSASSFQFQIDEWDYLDGVHIQETVSYMVVEAGEHILQNGKVLKANKVNNVNSNWKTVNFSGGSFSDNASIIAQCGSRNNAQAVTTRLRSVSRSGFQVKMQPQESNSGHSNETLYYIAIENGSQSTGLKYQSSRTGDEVTHAWKGISFVRSYASPAFFSQIMTYDGQDPAAMRYRNLSSSGVEIKIEEERSQNYEVRHTTEMIGYFVFNNPGDILGTTSNTFTNPEQNEHSSIVHNHNHRHELELNISPNPSKISDQINIEVKSEKGISHVRLVNSQGQFVYQKDIETVSAHDSNEVQLSLSAFKQGIYFVQLIHEEKIATKRLVITE